MRRNYTAIAAQYVADVISGAIAACRWVKLACERQANDLSRIERDDPQFPYEYHPAKGERVCKFLELLPHTEGAKQGQPIVLEPWQVFIFMTVFSWVHKYDDPVMGITKGKRRYRAVYIEVPRGSGKSTMSAGVALYMVCADGEGGAQCFASATSVEQAQAVYKPARDMVLMSPALREKMGLSVAAHRINHLKSGSYFRALPYKSKGKLDSLNVHLAIIDELHSHDNRECYDSITSGTGKRDQDLIWTITTAGFDLGGICYEKHKALQEVLEGKSKREDFFGIIYTVDDPEKWATIEALQLANPNWGVSVSPVKRMGELTEALQLASAQPSFKTKYLNIWCAADSAWLAPEAWAACGNPKLDEDDFAEDECILGMDLATRNDLCSLAKVYRRKQPVQKYDADGKLIEGAEGWHYYVFGKHWTPESTVESSHNSQYRGWAQTGRLTTCPGETNDFDLVEAHIEELASTTHIREIRYDKWQAHSTITYCQKVLGEDSVVVFNTGNASQFSPAMKECEALVHEGRIHHDGDPVLAWAINNVVCHRDARDNVYPRKQRYENKIDPAIAMLMALYGWTAYVEEDTGPLVSVLTW